jgi:integrase
MAIRKRAWTAPDGTAKQAWLVDYRDQSGKRRAKQFAKKKDAEAWSINAKAEVQRGVHTADSASITVSEAAQIWLDAVRADEREPTTIAAYDQHVRLHIIPACGATKLSHIAAPRVQAILDDWLLNLSRPMAVRLLRSLKAIITQAQVRGFVAHNAALAVKVRKVTREAAKAAPPTKADLRAILTVADKADAQARALIELSIFSGMRASELRGLTWANLNLKAGTVTVSQRADAKGVIGPPKSKAGFRTIPLPPRAVTALKAWKLACPANPQDLAFPNSKGKPLSHHILLKDLVGPVQIIAKVTSQADKTAPRYAMHAFRHAAASLWIDQGLNPKRVQYLMGHNSIQVTFDTYGHLFEQVQKDAQDAAAIERALFADAT